MVDVLRPGVSLFPVGFLRSDNDAKPLGPNVWCETVSVSLPEV